jgi:hypothetical protein
LIYNYVVGYGEDVFYPEVTSWLASESKTCVHDYAALVDEFSGVDLFSLLKAFDAQAEPSPNDCARTLGKMYEAVGTCEKTKASLFSGYTADLTIDREYLRLYAAYEVFAAIRTSRNNFTYLRHKQSFRRLTQGDLAGKRWPT